MSHFLYPRHPPELAYNIKTREANRFIDKKEHTIYRVLDMLPDEHVREILGRESTRIYHY